MREKAVTLCPRCGNHMYVKRSRPIMFQRARGGEQRIMFVCPNCARAVTRKTIILGRN